MRYLGPLTILLLINVIFYVGLFMLLSGCATVGTFTPKEPVNNVTIMFKDRVGVEYYCGEGILGCHIKTNNRHYVYSINEWCVLIHEIGHVIKGAFHDKAATCKTLPTNGE